MGFKTRTLSLPEPRGEEDLLAIGGLIRRFSMRELKQATNNFSRRNICGRGGFGTVYKGRLSEDGSLVAIKRLELRRSTQGEKEFLAEMHMASITTTGHPNLLRLRGFCITQHERLLVFPFAVNGSLDSMLFASDHGQCPLDWPTRKRVALGLAKGLAYMHQAESHFNTFLVHLDVKPSNILLNHDLEPVLCDFGISRALGQDHHSNSDWTKQYPFMNEETEEEEDNEEQNNLDRTGRGLVEGLTKCWKLTKTEVKSDSRVVVRQEAITCTWSCWRGTTSKSDSSDSTGRISEAPASTEHELLNFTCYITNRVCGTYGYMQNRP